MTCTECIHFGLCPLENEKPARCQHFVRNIVRCKDCEQYEKDILNLHVGYCNYLGTFRVDDFFCEAGRK